MTREWGRFKKCNLKAKLINIDIQANTTTQVPDGEGVLNIGGFSDNVWPVIAAFMAGKDSAGWVEHIKQTKLGS